MNKKLNNPTRQHHHPQYHPLRMLPNSAILDCNVMNSSEEKWYVVPQRLENTNCYISVIRVNVIDTHYYLDIERKIETTVIFISHCVYFAGLWTLIRIQVPNQLVENNGNRHDH